MKNVALILMFIMAVTTGYSQSKPSTKVVPVKVKDTIIEEVIEIETKYNPEIADASKIKRNPKIKLSERSQKKKLNYTIFSAPVASTFVPKSGVVKGVDVGIKERVFENYVALGFGNYTSPYFETYLHRYTRFDSEFGVSAKYNASFDNVENTLLDSDFSNLQAKIFYKKEERYFDWKVALATEQNSYNWYGISPNTFSQNVIDNINEAQTYSYFNIDGNVSFVDAFLREVNTSLSYFTDSYNSTEIFANLTSKFSFPLDFLEANAKNLDVNFGLELLNGTFENDYENNGQSNYQFFTANLNPYYLDVFGNFSMKLGAKVFGTFDLERDFTDVLLYPDIKLEYAIIKDFLNVYTGATGGLTTNTYKSFSEENPFVSPTLVMTQTSETYNGFLGINGRVNNDWSFNFSASYADFEDMPLFIQNNSKSDGLSNSFNNVPLQGYEYGNSFNVVYDDITRLSIFAETEFDFSKNLTFGGNFKFDNYSTTNQKEAWNLPTMQVTGIAKYKTHKWYATANIFYVGERKDVSYSSNFPASATTVNTVGSFVDANLNGGYHFSDRFSAFLQLNNVLGNNYQQFNNFNVQGFQILGGLTYKFDY